MPTTRFPNVIAALSELQHQHPEHAAEVDLALKMIFGDRPNIEQKYDALLLRLDRALSRLTDMRDQQGRRKEEATTANRHVKAKAKESLLNVLINDFQWMRARNADLIRALERQRDKQT